MANGNPYLDLWNELPDEKAMRKLQEEALASGDFSQIEELNDAYERLQMATDKAAKTYNINVPAEDAPQEVTPPPMPLQPPIGTLDPMNPQKVVLPPAAAPVAQPPVVVNNITAPPAAQEKPEFKPTMELDELKSRLSRNRLKELQNKVIELYKYKAPAISGEQLFGKYWNPKDNPDLLKSQDPIGFFTNLNPKFESIVAGINPAADPKYPDEGRATIDEARRIIKELTPVVPKSPTELAAEQQAKIAALPGAYTEQEKAAAAKGAFTPPPAAKEQGFGDIFVPANGVPLPPAVPREDTVIPEEEAMVQEEEARRAAMDPDDSLGEKKSMTDYEFAYSMGEKLKEPVQRVFTEPKAMVQDAQEMIERRFADYNREFQRRINAELGQRPKLNFLTGLGIILGALSGNQDATKMWMNQVNRYDDAKQRIGSEVFGSAKAEMAQEAAARRQEASLRSQEGRQTSRDEAAHKRQLETIGAQGDRLEKTLKSQEGRQVDRLAVQERLANMRANVALNGQKLQNLAEKARNLDVKKKARIVPYQEKLDILRSKQADVSRMASAGMMAPDEWAKQTAPIDADVSRLIDQIEKIMNE